MHKECESICDESADFISSLQEIVARDVSVRNVIWNGSPGPRGSPANSCSRGSRSSSRSSRTMRRRDRSAAHLSDARAKMPLDFDAPQQRGAVVCRPADVNATARFPVARHPRVFSPCLPPLCTAPIRLFPGRASPFPSFPTATHHRSTPTTCHSSSRPTSSSVLARGARCLLLRTTVLISVALPLSPSKLLLLSGATLWSGVLRVPRVL